MHVPNRLRRLLSLSLVTLVGIPLLANPTEKAFHELLAQTWEWQMREFPQFASYTGDHRFNHALTEVGVKFEKDRYKRRLAFRDQLKAIDRSELSPADQLNYDIFARNLNQSIEGYENKTYFFPLTNRSGFHLSFARYPEQVSLREEDDYNDYLSRLKAFGRYADQQIALLKQAVKEGYVLPKVVMEGYEDSIKTHIVEKVENSVFYKPLTSFSDRIDQAKAKALEASGRKIIGETVIPAYKLYYDFMVKEYLPACRDDLGAHGLPNGEKYYAHRVRHYTTLDVTPEQVHQKGLSEVKRIRAEMEEVKAKTGFDGDFAAFLKYLRTDPKFYPKTADELLREASYICKQMDGRLPKLFKKLPRTPYGIKVIPEDIAPKTTGAYYQQPSGDGTKAGFYYLNTYALDSRPLYILEALSFHEAVPGHHLQLAYQQELEDVPIFRRFSEVGAFVEGWALYSERLGLELGFYQDHYRDFGRLTYEMWRACRLVVDTGIHAKGWPRDKAIEYMASNTALSRHEITTEVDRYISWPGQALGYKMGEIKIRELRQKAEEEMGDQFDIREFHDVVLRNGSIPLNILAKQVQNYIETAKSTN